MEDGTYTFHPLKHMTTQERKTRSIWYADDEDKEIIAPVTEVLSKYVIPKLYGRTYSSIKGRGLLAMLHKTEHAARTYADGYYIQVDISKYYASIDHGLLMDELSKYIKDTRVLGFIRRRLTDYPVQGLPIGLSFSSYLANLYLTDIDRWAERRGLMLIRYMDDILVFCDSKEKARTLLLEMTSMIEAKGLSVKNNARIAPVTSGIFFCGFKIWPTHTLLRKNIREAIKKRHRFLLRKNVSDAEYKRKMAPYFGWMIHCNGWHLLRKTLGDKIRLFEKNIMEYKKLKDKRSEQNWFSLSKDARVSIRELVGKQVIIFESKEVTVYNENKSVFRFAYPEEESVMHYSITRSDVVMDRLRKDINEWPAIVTFMEKKGKNGRTYVCYE